MNAKCRCQKPKTQMQLLNKLKCINRKDWHDKDDFDLTAIETANPITKKT